MRIKYWFASCLMFVTTLSLSACAYPDLTPMVTPTAIVLYQDDDFAVAPTPLVDPAETPVAEPPPAVGPAVTPLPAETPAAEAPPVIGPAETPLPAETPATESPPVVVDVATPVTEETPDVEVPLILGETEIPAAEDTPVAEAPLVVETPVLEPTPALTPVVTPVAEETPAVQPPLIVGETAIPAAEDTPVAEAPLAVTPAVTPLPVETPVVEPTPVEPTPAPDVQVAPPLAARALVEASALRGRTVRNVERPGQTTVDHVVADLGTRQILFATIRYGALLRLADRRVPVPPEYLHWDPQDRRLLVTLPEGAIANMRSYDNRWPDLSDPGWTQDVRESWQPLDPNLFLHTPMTAVKADTVAGERVVGAGGTELAQVSDLLLNLETNQIDYIVLRMSGGFLGLGREYRAVPAELFEVQAIDREEGEITLLLDVQESTLRAAPAYDADLLQNGGATWELDNRRYWEMLPRHQQTAGN